MDAVSVIVKGTKRSSFVLQNLRSYMVGKVLPLIMAIEKPYIEAPTSESFIG